MALSLRHSLMLYGLAVVLAICGMAAFLRSAPPLPEKMCADIVTPMDVISGRLVREPQKSILGLWTCLREYKKDNWWHTTFGIWLIYAIFKVFGPLGAGTSMVLSILIGALYDEAAEPFMNYSLMAHLLGVSAEVLGGWGGFLLSKVVGREILLWFAPEKMQLVKDKMDKFEGSLFRYMLFIRVSPLVPNWFVNYSSGVLGMPSLYFLVASTLAIQPACCMSMCMGGLLREFGDTGLDLMMFGKRGAQMGCVMFVLSLPLIPADDRAAYVARAKRCCGFGPKHEKAA